jgi:hypothetical protein
MFIRQRLKPSCQAVAVKETARGLPGDRFSAILLIKHHVKTTASNACKAPWATGLVNTG